MILRFAENLNTEFFLNVQFSFILLWFWKSYWKGSFKDLIYYNRRRIMRELLMQIILVKLHTTKLSYKGFNPNQFLFNNEVWLSVLREHNHSFILTLLN